jgi:hypothetical protein
MHKPTKAQATSYKVGRDIEADTKFGELVKMLLPITVFQP